MKKIVLHFFDEDSAIDFKKNWESFNGKYGSIEQRGNICIIYYACNKRKEEVSISNLISCCQHCS